MKLNLDNIIIDLQSTKAHPALYFQPVSAEVLQNYLNGLYRGLALGTEEIPLIDQSKEFRLISRQRGLCDDAGSPFRDLPEQGFNEEQIIQIMLDVEIERWKIIKGSLTS
jgi:hypothetical protein